MPQRESTPPDNPSAFPARNFIVPGDLEARHVHALGETQGMTLRDYFAAAALQGFIAQGTAIGLHEWQVAKKSYAWADAMLKERSK